MSLPWFALLCFVIWLAVVGGICLFFWAASSLGNEQDRMSERWMQQHPRRQEPE